MPAATKHILIEMGATFRLSAIWKDKITGQPIDLTGYTARMHVRSALLAADPIIELNTANTWISGIAYGNQGETFTTGSNSVDVTGQIFIAKEATGRIFRFDVNKNRLVGLTVNTNQQALGGTAVEGDKMFLLPFTEDATTLMFLYVFRHSAGDLMRMLLI